MTDLNNTAIQTTKRHDSAILIL